MCFATHWLVTRARLHTPSGRTTLTRLCTRFPRKWVNMLVLTRKVNDSIVIADHIVLTVVAVSPSRVRLRIQAPSHVPIMREELAQERRPSWQPPRATGHFVASGDGA